MIIDLSRCVGCHSCAVACRAAWQVPLPHQRNWVHRLGPDRTPHGVAHTFYPGQCNHCAKPPCVPVCPVDQKEKVIRNEVTGEIRTITVGATWKDPFTGTVVIDQQRCIGCGACVSACPYEARFLRPDTELPKAEACDFCLPRLQRDATPVCVAACPTDARIFGDLQDPQSAIAQRLAHENAVQLEPPATPTGPNIHYLGPPRDLALLQDKCTPAAGSATNIRRALLGTAMRAATPEFPGAGAK